MPRGHEQSSYGDKQKQGEGNEDKTRNKSDSGYLSRLRNQLRNHRPATSGDSNVNNAEPTWPKIGDLKNRPRSKGLIKIKELLEQSRENYLLLKEQIKNGSQDMEPLSQLSDQLIERMATLSVRALDPAGHKYPTMTKLAWIELYYIKNIFGSMGEQVQRLVSTDNKNQTVSINAIDEKTNSMAESVFKTAEQKPFNIQLSDKQRDRYKKDMSINEYLAQISHELSKKLPGFEEYTGSTPQKVLHNLRYRIRDTDKDIKYTIEYHSRITENGRLDRLSNSLKLYRETLVNYGTHVEDIKRGIDSLTKALNTLEHDYPEFNAERFEEYTGKNRDQLKKEPLLSIRDEYGPPGLDRLLEWKPLLDGWTKEIENIHNWLSAAAPYTKVVADELDKLQDSHREVAFDKDKFKQITGLTPDEFRELRPDLKEPGFTDYAGHCKAWCLEQMTRLTKYSAYEKVIEVEEKTNKLWKRMSTASQRTLVDPSSPGQDDKQTP